MRWPDRAYRGWCRLAETPTSASSAFTLHLHTLHGLMHPALPSFEQNGIYFLGSWHSKAEQFATLRSLITRDTRIAVVGSSGNLIDQRHGANIDKHDVIIRMNSAGFKGHEVDVGSRTDLRVGWGQGMPPVVVNTSSRKHTQTLLLPQA